MKLKQFGANRIIQAGKIDEVKYSDEVDFSQFACDLFSSLKGVSKVS
jgi:hypothetical protein